MNVFLRPVTPADFGSLHEWNQDETFCRAAGWTPGLIRRAVNASWKRLLAAPERDFLRLGIESDEQLVGYADLAGIDQTSGSAEFGIAVAPSCNWGRGIGRAAGLLMLRHGFQVLKLPCVWAEVHAPNLRSLALMRKLGFQQEGVGAEQMYDG
ncbi:GNAT family N-acetyltransferase, partial [Deinococcus sp.]|uniref:GNAT family N-acetyltransferase n=1 Tax=Deinococcus sp. TaxID=47478 RepID=UPI00286E66E7